MGGVAAMMIDIPERELSVAVLANSTNKAARDAVVDHLMGTLAPGFHSDQLNPITEQNRPTVLAQGEWAGEISTAEGGIPLWIRIRAGGRRFGWRTARRSPCRPSPPSVGTCA